MLAVDFTGLGWLGVRTERFEETARFFRNVMGLQQIRQESDLAGFAFPDGTEVEVWRPEEEFHAFFGTGPVVGFRVGPVQRSEKAAWVHFRGPDGNVYEIIGQR
jgi:catechol 2,3-dioxygenase-like lactoylglutathione lyase family enzyme